MGNSLSNRVAAKEAIVDVDCSDAVVILFFHDLAILVMLRRLITLATDDAENLHGGKPSDNLRAFP